MKALFLSVIALAFFCAAIAFATETIIYTYDAKGRLVRVVQSGIVDNNVTTDYTHDKANNRKTVVRTGSLNPPPPNPPPP